MKLAEPRLRRWTREEYYQMGDLGFFEGQRVELIEGEVIERAPQKERHAVAINLVQRALEKTFPAGHWVRVQMPLMLGDVNEPEPDIAVVQGESRAYAETDHPRTALLVVEVSEATLRFDRARKAELYAAAGIADYWIANLVDLQLEVLRKPVADAVAQLGFSYSDRVVLKSGDSISPLAVPDAAIPVADLLP